MTGKWFAMVRQVFIDGNNLLFAIRDRAAATSVGRETLVRIIGRWARQIGIQATLVFDGPTPRGDLARQMSGTGITVRFSGQRTADDLIVEALEQVGDPATVCVVSDDAALLHAARYRRCRVLSASDLVIKLFPAPGSTTPPPAAVSPPTPEKPDELASEPADEWLRTFGFNSEVKEPFPGADAMEP